MKVTDCPDCTDDICHAHRHALVKALGLGHDSLPILYTELNLALVPGRAGNDEPVVTMSRTRRLPIAGNIRGAQERILTTVVDVEAWVRAELGWMPAPPRGREAPTLQAACDVLRDHLDQWASLGEAVPQAARLLGLAGVARSALGVAGPRHNRIDLPCPECANRSLRRANGRDDIACMFCGVVVELAWIEQQLDMSEPDHDQREAA